MSQCTGVDKIWSALYSSGALAEREVENKIGHAFSTFAVVVLALGHFAKLADCGFATIYLIIIKWDKYYIWILLHRCQSVCILASSATISLVT